MLAAKYVKHSMSPSIGFEMKIKIRRLKMQLVWISD